VTTARSPRRPAGGRFFAPPLPRIFAHRGLALEFPENTIGAFRRAIEAGATHLETDAHSSADGVAVLSHDPDLRRVLGRDVRIDRLTMAELEQTELGGGECFTSLENALRSLPEARFNIDIKSADAITPVVEAIRTARAIDRVLVVSFDEGRRARAVAGLPGVATAASTSGTRTAIAGAKLGIASLVRRGLAGVDAVQVPERYGRVRLITPRVVRAIHETGREIHVWTVNDPADMRRLLDAGVDGLVSDRCDLVRAVVDG
jgi:glycerophosphoryl diester phosphodiesterase